ncbi:2'-5' RNA ligase family protein [Gleimia europaea]|nr:2'-5' RNA ligase family protein [Gleimia europaea]MDK8534214.1 2'-5' RNA ligase family protein [Gleimia europaea]
MYLPPCGPDEELIGILVAVPEPLAGTIDELRTRLSFDTATDTAPHITLVPPTPVKQADRERIMHHLGEIAAKYAPFRICLRGAGSFRPVSPVSFINVAAGGEALAVLEDEIRGAIALPVPRFPFHPHVTLAHVEHEETLEQAERLAADFEAEWIASGFRLDRVGADGTYHSQALFSFTAG